MRYLSHREVEIMNVDTRNIDVAKNVLQSVINETGRAIHNDKDLAKVLQILDTAKEMAKLSFLP